mmetsp:Transcript_22622/g.33829  ORF Transcript_22622/g.33829 Transcript_22622/m.33829 type:complete len:241 (+) Transcript_22622:138-860(+)
MDVLKPFWRIWTGTGMVCRMIGCQMRRKRVPNKCKLRERETPKSFMQKMMGIVMKMARTLILMRSILNLVRKRMITTTMRVMVKSRVRAKIKLKYQKSMPKKNKNAKTTTTTRRNKKKLYQFMSKHDNYSTNTKSSPTWISNGPNANRKNLPNSSSTRWASAPNVLRPTLLNCRRRSRRRPNHRCAWIPFSNLCLGQRRIIRKAATVRPSLLLAQSAKAVRLEGLNQLQRNHRLRGGGSV